MRIVLIYLLSITASYGQTNDSLIIQMIINKEINSSLKNNSSSLTVSNIKITDSYISTHNQVRHIYFKQLLNGLELEGTEGNMNLKGTDRVLNYKSNFVDVKMIKTQISTPSVSGIEALMISTKKLGITVNESNIEALKAGNRKNEMHFNIPGIADQIVIIKLVYRIIKDKPALCWKIWISSLDGQFSGWIYVDAQSGIILSKINQILECSFDPIERTKFQNNKNQPSIKFSTSIMDSVGSNSYVAYGLPKENPNDGSRDTITSPWSQANNASPYGWHDTDGVLGPEYTISRGNNVFALEDIDGLNSTLGGSPDGGPDIIFNFPIDLNSDPGDYWEAATTNLFYTCNMIHDISYQYGFDEASGNFQENNYGKGGAGNDAVEAQAQDGSELNNARFYSTPEGIGPRIEMYNWDAPDIMLEVHTPESIMGNYPASGAEFGPQVYSVTGELVIPDPDTACSALQAIPSVNGKIALIDRGFCNFFDKLKNAQNAGAIAVVICNNVDDPTFTMGSPPGADNNEITIPGIFITKNDCEVIKAELPGVTVSMESGNTPLKDGDLDNGIILHEYAHGISIRLTGGPSKILCLSNNEQMGEGWSDYFAKWIVTKPTDVSYQPEGIGNYVTNQQDSGPGIRNFPYSSDQQINPYRYADINSVSIPHGVGSIWAEILWEMTWAIIEKYGFDPDLYNGNGGNNIAMQLVMDGLKLQPCRPGFVDGRDAILLADTINNGAANACLIWEAFAKRGLGFSASQGSSSIVGDETEAFDMPPACSVSFLGCTDTIAHNYNSMAYIYSNCETCDDGIENGPENGVDCGNVCPQLCPCTNETLTYNNTTILNATDEKANQWIQTIGTVSVDSNSVVRLVAGDFIMLSPGFSIPSGSEIKILAEECELTVPVAPTANEMKK